jgi:hypothetical protein
MLPFGTYTQMIKGLLHESAHLSRNFARKSSVEFERIVKILARQAEYTDEENKFSGGKAEGYTSLSGNRQVAK